MVKASAPAARTAATRSARIDATRRPRPRLFGKSAPAGGDEVERLGFGRAVSENVDARAAHLGEGPALRLDLRRRSAEPRRMAAWLAGERQVARRACPRGAAAPPRRARRPSADQRRGRGRARLAQFGLARRRHDLHPRGCAGGANGGGQATEHSALSPTSLKPIWRNPSSRAISTRSSAFSTVASLRVNSEDEVHGPAAPPAVVRGVEASTAPRGNAQRTSGPRLCRGASFLLERRARFECPRAPENV